MNLHKNFVPDVTINNVIEKRFPEFSKFSLITIDASLGQNSLVQAREIGRYCNINGAVLTKLDTDAKGGAGLSIAHATGQPIILCGVGQEYDDLIQFDPDWLLQQLFE